MTTSQPDSAPSFSPRLLQASCLLLLVLASLLAASTAAEQAARTSFEERCGTSDQSVSVRGKNGNYEIDLKKGRCHLTVETRGEIVPLDDESDIASLARGASLEIREELGSEKRHLRITSEGGKPAYEWSVDGQSAPFDDEARAWFAIILPQIYRSTGIDVEGRVARLLARGGAEAVFPEIRQLSNDHTQRRYLEELARQTQLSDEELTRVFKIAAQEISNDFETAELLTGLASGADSEDLQVVYAKTAESIRSDFEMRRALTALLERDALSASGFEAAVRTARAIDSDFELAKLLIEARSTYPQGEALPEAYFEALRGVESDFEHRRALDSVLHPVPAPETVAALLKSAASGIDSDYEMAELLVAVSQAHPIDELLRESFDEALASVGSQHERQRVEAALRTH
jgi:hypothetical protein